MYLFQAPRLESVCLLGLQTCTLDMIMELKQLTVFSTKGLCVSCDHGSYGKFCKGDTQHSEKASSFPARTRQSLYETENVEPIFTGKSAKNGGFREEKQLKQA